MVIFNETPTYPKDQTSNDIIKGLSTGKLSVFQVSDIITVFEAAMRITNQPTNFVGSSFHEDYALIRNKGGRAVKDLNWLLPIN